MVRAEGKIIGNADGHIAATAAARSVVVATRGVVPFQMAWLRSWFDGEITHCAWYPCSESGRSDAENCRIIILNVTQVFLRQAGNFHAHGRSN